MRETMGNVPEEETGATRGDSAATGQEESFSLDLDQEKVEAWDEVKGDYQVDPDGNPIPNSMDVEQTGQSSNEAEEPAASASSSPHDTVASDRDAEDEDDIARGLAPPPG